MREVGHYRNTCQNLWADFNTYEIGVVVAIEDLFDGNYV